MATFFFLLFANKGNPKYYNLIIHKISHIPWFISRSIVKNKNIFVYAKRGGKHGHKRVDLLQFMYVRTEKKNQSKKFNFKFTFSTESTTIVRVLMDGMIFPHDSFINGRAQVFFLRLASN